MILRSLNDALVLDKPAGMSTHTPDSGQTLGFTEVAEKLLGEKLWAVHRLDRDTSGALICATKAEAVGAWTEKLKTGVKKYIFISPHESPESVWSFEGRIEKVGSHTFDLVEGEPNSHTTFAKLGHNSLGFIYEAEITTGKTHQIRIHAQKSGIPILGDSEHGGKSFLRLMLHSLELQLDGSKIFSEAPLAFLMGKDLEQQFVSLPQDLKTSAMKFLISVDRRRFLKKPGTNAYRVIHREWFPKMPIVVEKLGDVLQVMNYGKHPLDSKLLTFFSNIAETRHCFVRQMENRGKIKNISEETEINVSASPQMPLQWQVRENEILFDLRHSQGMSSGLFLDQRENRNIIFQTAHGKKVANFFSYTCGFSVAAALGGGAEVVSVDTSQASLGWGQDNFRINKLDPEKYEFFSADALFFLKACVKRGRKFDVIILDPPTFSRGKHGLFRLSEQLYDLVKSSLLSLEKGGRLLFTFNDEDLDLAQVSRTLEKASQEIGHDYLKIERVHPPYDFEFPLERNTVLKGFWIYT